VITIVSGLPRSGTSLMMQMLVAGGMSALTDGERVADTDNPRGYYEWEPIKKLLQDPNCIDEAEGKVVKVISQLLFALPAGRSYHIVFLDRPLPEVIASQSEMIRRRGTTGAALSPAALIAGLQAHLNQVNSLLQRRSEIRVLRIPYHEVLSGAKKSAEELQRFLQQPLDIDSMARQVDQSLYRQRREKTAQ
jgi:hypothetical protein